MNLDNRLKDKQDLYLYLNNKGAVSLRSDSEIVYYWAELLKEVAEELEKSQRKIDKKKEK